MDGLLGHAICLADSSLRADVVDVQRIEDQHLVVIHAILAAPRGVCAANFDDARIHSREQGMRLGIHLAFLHWS